MKKYLLLLLLASFTVEAQIVNIPDANFKAKLLEASPENQIARNLQSQFFKIDANDDGEIQESEAIQVRELNVSNSNIASLEGILFFLNLNSLDAKNMQLTTLDLSNLNSLQTIICLGNQLTYLDLSGLSNLYGLNCSFNQLTNLDISSLTNLHSLICNNNQISTLDFSQLDFVNFINCSHNLLQDLVLDDIFVDSFTCSYNLIESITISNASFGTFLCTDNYNLINLSLTNIENTQSLHIYNNSLEHVIIDNVNSNGISLSNNQITSITINNLDCDGISLDNNQITELVLDNVNSSFYELVLDNNPIQSLTLSNFINNDSYGTLRTNNTTLTNFTMINSFINALDFRNNQLQNFELINSYVKNLDISNNLLTSLDISDTNNSLSPFTNASNNHIGIAISFENNPLELLFIKNSLQDNLYTLVDIDFPSLNYICSDEFEIEDLAYYTDYVIPVNSYCSFVPGGEFFTIQGNSKLELSGNSCDENSIDFPNMKFNITNGTISGNIISNTSGDYSIPVQAGTHTITPVFENPTYFNVSPPNVVVAFPTETSPFTQNFCVTPNGVHPDVEVIIVPLGTAIPGFDASYKLVYKNKGNTTVSGSISFTFMDNVMDFMEANPVQSMVEPNILNWNYTDLQPFETREIIVTFNLNSPQETPALNDSDVLNFIAIIDPLSGDEMPSDNTSTLNQTVFNSYDPNDKTCLEGSVVSTELIGQYVHYVIRFENTGTFFAQNVVVKDEIDLSKFDLNSLIVQNASHQQWTRINGNKVEFIFENIQLPFPPSEERHGYIAFKIKLKNNLTVGDTFSNFASIYFDYNFPIITEPAITTVEALSTSDFEFSSFVKLYPNPASSTITIESQSSINLKSVEIFNSLGQLVQAIPNENNQLNIDVSNLQTGTYFVKVYSDKGVGVSKFVKQ